MNTIGLPTYAEYDLPDGRRVRIPSPEPLTGEAAYAWHKLVEMRQRQNAEMTRFIMDANYGSYVKNRTWLFALDALLRDMPNGEWKQMQVVSEKA